ncbi:MAG: DUF4192 domain-containing protein [Actinobacteria bacterium]|nr:DUF4192 domain-containing protein [Actinomycetota bacterium]
MSTLTTPKDLLSAVPFLIGFNPQDSIVLLSLKNAAIAMAIRIDFPTQISGDELRVLTSHLSRDNAESAIAIFYKSPIGESQKEVISAVLAAISDYGLSLREVITVEQNRYRSLICEDQVCCPEEGNELPELIESRVAAEQVAEGRPIPYATLEQLIESISALDGDKELVELVRKVDQIDYDQNLLLSQRQGARAVNDFIKEFEEHGLVKDKELIALLLVRLKDLQVRDYALGSVGAASLDTCFTAWRFLLRLAPKGYIAPVANLFAAVAYERGDGALAQRALDRAEQDDPTYSMSKLLRQVFSSGWAPNSFAQMRSELHPKICSELFSGTI